MEARSNNSRSREFDILFCYLKNPKELLNKILKSSGGGKYNFEGINFEYGNISRLASTISIDESFKKPFNIIPEYICHIDHLSKSRKLEIESEFKLDAESISSQKSKVDILIVDKNHEPYYISYKDSASATKLGQVSSQTKYENASLRGGLYSPLPGNKIPESIKFSDTSLTDSQFKKLSQRDKEFAFYKKHYSAEWEKFVEQRMNDAISQLRKFGEIIKTDNQSLLSFIGQTIAKDLMSSSKFYLLLGDKVIRFIDVLNKIKEIEPEVIIKEYITANKFSLIIGLNMNNKEYFLTKIEPAFDGAGKGVSQTKGIIYYFQQYPANGNHFKKLFYDIS